MDRVHAALEVAACDPLSSGRDVVIQSILLEYSACAPPDLCCDHDRSLWVWSDQADLTRSLQPAIPCRRQRFP